MFDLQKFALSVLVLLLLTPGWLAASVSGTVRNATTGKPQSGVPLTLLKFQGGMDPVGETFSGAEGRYLIDRELPEAATGQPFRGVVRAEFQGVGYSVLIRSSDDLSNIELTVYEVAGAKGLVPNGRIFLLEPGANQIVITETYVFDNKTSPPVTYRDPELGALRFYLPAGAEGKVRVQGTGPAGMPLPSSAEPAGQPDLYRVDFPVKPGDNRLDATYVVPRGENNTIQIRAAYPNLVTRVVAPEGVKISGAGVQPMGKVPDTQTSVFQIPSDDNFALTIEGVGNLGAGPGAGAGGVAPSEGPSISIQPAPVAQELTWILGIVLAIFAIGFYRLYTANSPVSAESQPPAERKKGRRKS